MTSRVGEEKLRMRFRAGVDGADGVPPSPLCERDGEAGVGSNSERTIALNDALACSKNVGWLKKGIEWF